MEDLTAEYKRLKTQYDALIAKALANPSTLQTMLPQIQTVNQQMASVVDKLLVQLQYARDGPNSDAYRAQLTETLSRIQMDYNGLKTNTDALQTLKRIRAFQDSSWKSTLTTYIAIFLAVSILFALVLLFRRQTKVSTAAPMPSATAMPTLT